MIIIESCQIEGFGKLSGTYRFGSGFNVLFGPNEAGKSTLFAAVLYGIYGFPVNRRSSEMTLVDRDAYKPGETSPFKISVVLKRSDERITIERNFQLKTLRVISDRHGRRDITDQYLIGKGTDNVGEILLGLSLRQYYFISKSFSDSQMPAASSVGKSEEDNDVRNFLDPLQRMLGSSEASVSSSAAISALRRALSEYPGSTASASRKTISVEEEIRRLEREIVDFNEAICEIDEKEKESAEKLSEIDKCKIEIGSIEAGLWRAELRELEEKLGRNGRFRETLQTVDVRLAKLNEAIRMAGDCGRFSFEKENDLRETALQCAAVTDQSRQKELEISSLRKELCDMEERIAKLQPKEDAEQKLSYPQVARFLENTLHGMHESEARLSDSRAKRRAIEAALESQGFRPAHLVQFYRALSELELSEQMNLLKNDQELRVKLESERSRLVDQEFNEHTVARRTGLLQKLWIASGVVFLGLGPIGIFLNGKMAHVPLITVICGVLFAVVFTGLYFVKGSAIRKLSGVRERLNQQRVIVQQLDGEITGYDNLIERFCGRAGRDLLEVKNQWVEYLKLRSIYEELVYSEKEEERISNESRSKRTQLVDYLKTLGFSVVDGEDERVLASFQVAFDTVKELETLSGKQAELRVSLGRAESEGQRFDREAGRLSGRIREIAEEIGIQDYDSAQVVSRLDTLKERFLSKKQAETEQVQLAEKKGAVERELLSLEEVTKAETEIERLRNRLKRITVLEVRQGSAVDLRETLEGLRARREALEKEVLLIQREKEDRLPELRAGREQKTEALQLARAHFNAVAVARDLISKLSIDLQSQWVKPLNTMLNQVLKQFHSGVSRVMIDPECGVQLVLPNGDILSEAALHSSRVSTGTRELIYFAMKIVLAQLLTQGRPVPILMDDPFIAYDDDRFETMFRIMKEGMPSTQILYLTCHEQRVEFLKSRGLLEDCRIINVATGSGSIGIPGANTEELPIHRA